MKVLDWFVEILQTHCAAKVSRNQIGYEANELYLDEVDELFIPYGMEDTLPEKMLFETLIFNEEDGTEWLGVIVIDSINSKLLFQVLLKDGEPVLRKLIDDK